MILLKSSKSTQPRGDSPLSGLPAGRKLLNCPAGMCQAVASGHALIKRFRPSKLGGGCVEVRGCVWGVVRALELKVAVVRNRRPFPLRAR